MRIAGARRLLGAYIPTKKNAMVKDHYTRLGFAAMDMDATGGSRSLLDLAHFTPIETFVMWLRADPNADRG
jgi:predicted enzyme involved in methoxymalonyl-ACP biosynthesis